MFKRYSSFWHSYWSLEQKMRSFFSQHWHKIYSLEILVNDQKSHKKVPPEMTKKTDKIIAEKLFLQLWNPFYGSCFHVKMEERETTSERRRGAWMKIGAFQCIFQTLDYSVLAESSILGANYLCQISKDEQHGIDLCIHNSSWNERFHCHRNRIVNTKIGRI